MKKVTIILLVIMTSFASFAQKSKAGVNKENNTAVTSYSCPMHPDVISNKAGKCTICGSNLVLSPKEKMKMSVMKIYTCPMHPDVESDKNGKCPKCGMDMVVKKKVAKLKY